jgi:phosphoglucomutase
MPHHPLAGRPAPVEARLDIQELRAAYTSRHPDPEVRDQRVAFGTSGHRGTSIEGTFNEAHLLAICQAIAETRRERGVSGPLFLGRDTHALSEPAHDTATEVLAANGVELRIQAAGGYTPTPAVSFAILEHNRGRRAGLADGIILTPSHNPPGDGGIKYNPPHGGPAGTDETSAIETRANAILAGSNRGVRRMPREKALAAPSTRVHDFIGPYVAALAEAIDFDVIRESGVRIGVDPMGGAGLAYWEPIAGRYRLDLEVVNTVIDPTFSFMTLDHDGVVRMDCSSPHAMANLIALRDRFDVAFGNDPDADRHGIVTPRGGLLNPNHVLALAVSYLGRHRPAWGSDGRIAKTLVSSSMIDRVATDLRREVYEVPVGFKWFVDGLRDGSVVFAGEESAGASFVRRNGEVWTTDKDGILLNLLAAEMTAAAGRDLSDSYADLEARFGRAIYRRSDVAASVEERTALKNLTPSGITARELAGEPIVSILTHAPGNGAAIGGVKVVAANGWFAARPSGTEAIYKIYAESFRGAEHLDEIQRQAESIVASALGRSTSG